MLLLPGISSFRATTSGRRRLRRRVEWAWNCYKWGL